MFIVKGAYSEAVKVLVVLSRKKVPATRLVKVVVVSKEASSESLTTYANIAVRCFYSRSYY